MKNPTLPNAVPLRFHIRKLNEHFPYRRTPLYHPEQEEAIAAWSVSFSKTPDKAAFIHTIGCEICLLVAAVYPDVTDYDRYEILCKNFIVQVLVDDHAEESWGQYAAHKDISKTQKYLLKVINAVENLGGSAAWYKQRWGDLLLKIPGIYPPWVREILKNYKQIIKAMPAFQQQRCINTLNDFWKGTFEQVNWTNKSAILTEESYLQYRQLSLDAIHCFFLIEYAKNIRLTDEEYKHPTMQQLILIGCRHVLYVNDLFSCLKEYKGDFQNFNHIIGVLVRSKELSVQQAVDDVCKRIEQCEESFIKIRDEWYAGPEIISGASRSYIAGMQDWMAGLLFWSRKSKRYWGSHFSGMVTQGDVEWSPDGPKYEPGDHSKMLNS